MIPGFPTESIAVDWHSVAMQLQSKITSRREAQSFFTYQVRSRQSCSLRQRCVLQSCEDRFNVLSQEVANGYKISFSDIGELSLLAARA